MHKTNFNPHVLPDLPIKACLEDLYSALRHGHVTLSATPGSGKTTVVPIALLDQPWLEGKKIIVLEPRRPAARMAAHRMAFLLGEKVGQTIGYQVRFDRQISRQTRIEVLTEGLLLRRLQSDPELADVGLVIFDEFHERNLVADLSLALCLDICRGLRDDLRLLVMSASLDEQAVNQLLGAQQITAGGQLHPVTIHYAKQDAALNQVVDDCLPLIEQALQTVAADVLVFLPGRGEITRLQALAEERWGNDCEVLTLYGELSTEQQDRVLRPASRGKRRLILSTDIAETSLTIEGIEAVVDGGRARKPVFQPNSGLTRLETRWISKASALQRAGRAGRLGPGHCFRAWTAARQQRLEDWIRPEILDADLAPLALELAAWGVTEPEEMLWLDAPPKAHWQQAVELLQQLQAVNEQGHITALGKRMSSLPVHPRLAHMLSAATGQVDQQLAADIAALLSDRDPLLRRSGEALPADIRLRLDALADWRQGRSVSACDKGRLKQLDRLSSQFMKMLPKAGKSTDSRFSVGSCLAIAYPDRIAKRRSNSEAYLMRNGRGVSLPPADSLSNAEFLAIANLDAGQRDGKVWLAASISLADIEGLFAEQIVQQRQVRWDNQRQAVVARERQTLGEIVLIEQQAALQTDDPVAELLLEQIKKQSLSLFGEQKKFDLLRARVQAMHRLEPDADWPDVSEVALLDQLDQWLSPWLDRVDSLKQLKQVDLLAALTAWLGWDKQQRLDKMLPESFATPAGTRRPITYDLNEAPVLKAPLQELLGLSESPRVANGRLPLVIHLLSPAGRPLQVTQDLATFWAGAYQEVKKEMRGRYPKHYWPDDPASASATRFTKRRMSE
ncbi:MAG: ATP-dependent helicase HrpB [Chromatiales bacterium]|jgi:ATP-dependent helicase HrpB